MWNEANKEKLSQIPKLYQTEDTPTEDKLVRLHFFMGTCDWYVVEYDGRDTFWGFVILNGDFQNAEWGYFSLEELKELKVQGRLEMDCELEESWKVKRAIEIPVIKQWLAKLPNN